MAEPIPTGWLGFTKVGGGRQVNWDQKRTFVLLAKGDAPEVIYEHPRDINGHIDAELIAKKVAFDNRGTYDPDTGSTHWYTR